LRHFFILEAYTRQRTLNRFPKNFDKKESQKVKYAGKQELEGFMNKKIIIYGKDG